MQPLLRLAIADDPARFVPTDNPIPLREVSLTAVDDAGWVREIDEHEFVHSIDWRSGRLARAVVLRQPDQVNDLVISVPHCISDGTTALALLRQWVRLAAAPPASAPDVPDEPVPPPVEALFPARFRTSARARLRPPGAGPVQQTRHGYTAAGSSTRCGGSGRAR